MTKIIAIDLGTTLIKCSLYDESGKTLATESTPCQPVYPAHNRVEQDADVWYEGVCEAIKHLVALCDAEDIKGISVSSQGISIVPVDENFHPLCKAISWLDSRANDECKYLLNILSEKDWFRITGKFLSSLYTLPKLLWLKNNEPEIFSSAYKFLMPMDYVNARMTGMAVTDHTMAAGTMLYNIAQCNWDNELLKLLSINTDRLAEIKPSDTLVGCINKETADRTGLSPKTQVFNGGQDQKVAAYSAEITKDRASLSLGTAGALEIFVEDATKQSLLPFFPYIIPGQTLVEGCINTTGAAIGWFKSNLAPDISYDELNLLAESAKAGSNGICFYPHLSSPGTPHKNLNEYGTIEGINLGSSRGDMMRSLYEGLSYEIRLNLEYAKKAGSNLTEIIVFGGASKSSVFCQIIADVTGLKTLATENGEMSGVGAAKLAMRGLGLNETEFARIAGGSAKVYMPDNNTTEKYNKLYEKYIKHYEREE